MPNAASVPRAEDILGNIADALALVDLSGRIIYANDRLGDLFGLPADRLRDRTWRELVDPNAADRLDPANWRDLECPEVHFNIDLPSSSGAPRTFCLTASPVRDETGRTIGILQNFRGMDKLRDMILELRDVADAIRREKDKTEQVIDSIADGIFTVDAGLVIRSFSPRLERLLGIAAADAVGRSCQSVLRGTKCDTDCPMRWTLERGAVVERCSEIIRRGDRTGLPVSITTAFLHDPHGAVEGLIGVVRDNSEVERLRREISERSIQLREPQGAERPAGGSAPAAPRDAPAKHLRLVLEEHRWNASRAARSLGISRTTLWRRMKEHGLLQPR